VQEYFFTKSRKNNQPLQTAELIYSRFKILLCGKLRYIGLKFPIEIGHPGIVPGTFFWLSVF